MPPPEMQLPAMIGLLILATLYIPLIVYASTHGEGQESSAGFVNVFALFGLMATAVEAFWRGGRIPGKLGPGDPAHLHLALLAPLSALTVMVLYSFLRRGRWWIWVVALVLWAIGLVAVGSWQTHLKAVIWTNGVFTLEREGLTPAWVVLGCAVFILAGAVTAGRARARTRQPLLRNRLSYWLLLYLLLAVDTLLLARKLLVPGEPLRLAAAILITGAALKHDLPDIREIARRVLVYLITTLLLLSLYVAGLLLFRYLFRAAPDSDPLPAGAAIALLLALLFTPLLGIIRRLVGRWLRLDEYDRGRLLHEYGERIRNVLDMQRLAGLVVGIILETLRLERGYLFLVNREPQQDGRILHRLHLARSQADPAILPMYLEETGPICSSFLREQRPLLQYDLDLLPVYRSVMPLEREWFSRLEAEVYVPIFARRKWLGLLALGPKISGNRYTAEDLVTLSALANQTGVALENALLVDRLLKLNTELRQARRLLERSNRDLERLDRVKSEFISIASHELRTPLTLIKGYTEMLVADPGLDPAVADDIRGIHEGVLRLNQVMDSMFDIAALDARSFELNLQAVQVRDLLERVCSEQRQAVQSRRQSLTLELPVLPIIRADPNGLEKVFERLLSNAIKFNPDGGHITITGNAVPPEDGTFPEGGLEIVVADTGVGIDPRLQEAIFSRFYQPGEINQHSSSRSGFKGGGTGLGLALSKGIVDAHGGRIWVESPGCDEIHFPGSKFHVLLPLPRRKPLETRPVASALHLDF